MVHCHPECGCAASIQSAVRARRRSIAEPNSLAVTVMLAIERAVDDDVKPSVDSPATCRRFSHLTGSTAYQTAWVDSVMHSPTTLTLVDGVRIVVPDTVHLITPYVLFEQHDWFEDELRFLRRMLRPGQKVIDVGANYGVYTLSMAQAVGPGGSVWAFEPASSTAAFLTQGVAANKFSHIIIERNALSSACGSAQLALNDHSELNALVRNEQPTQSTETVPVVTLDDCLRRYGWTDIDFIKIDAEGEETNILEGGRRFFGDLSPLIQYEVKVGTDVHMGLVRDFAALGYDSYRLVPALDLLVPFNDDSAPDDYLLNLFCCKRDRAAQLMRQGFLIDSTSSTARASTRPPNEAIYGDEQYSWRRVIGKMPYGARLTRVWENATAAEGGASNIQALAAYAMSRDPARSSSERWQALQTSFLLAPIALRSARC